jgi:hypothetical protein
MSMSRGTSAKIFEIDQARKNPMDTSRIYLVPFDDIRGRTTPSYLIKGVIPRVGLGCVWGEPKSGKSFWALDVAMHVALGWDYRGKRVQQGPAVYIAAEGQTGVENRIEAWRQNRLEAYEGDVPFYLCPVNLDLIADHGELIGVIRQTTADPAIVTIDTLNRTLRGSENSDEDMSAFVEAADAIREAFNCAVMIIHHCGIDGTRARGHTSLRGSLEVLINVKRNKAGDVITTVEEMKDGEDGEVIASRLVTAQVGIDDDGDPITSCIVEPTEHTAPAEEEKSLTANQEAMFRILREAKDGLSQEDWYAKTKAAGIGKTRPATLTNTRGALEDRGLVYQYNGRWCAKK